MRKAVDNRCLMMLMAAACAALLILKAPMLAGDGLARTPMGADDASLLHAVHRAVQGHRFSVAVQKKESDLSHVTYDYPRTQAPGSMIATRALAGTGMSVERAYKILRVLAALLGVCGWLVLGRLFLARGPLALFAFVLVFYLAWGWVKLGDTMVWCLAAPYFMALHALVISPRISPLRVILLIGIVACCLVFWPGSVYLGAAAGGCILFFGAGGLRTRILACAAVAAGGAVFLKIISLAISAYAGPGGFIQGVTVDSSPFGIPLSHSLPAVKALFAEGLGAWMPLKWAMGRFAPEPVARVAALGVPVLAQCAAGMRAWARRVRRGPTERFALTAVLHYLTLFSVLFSLSAIFTDGVSLKSDVNGIIQADRYMYHLVPAIAIVWISALWDLSASGREKSVWRVARGAVLLMAMATLPWLAAHRVHHEFMAPGRAVDPAAAYVRAQSGEPGQERIKVFDIIAKEHWLAGESRAFQEYLSPEELRESRNSEPVYVYVAVRNDLEKMPHRPDPDRSARHALNMAEHLDLQLLNTWRDGRIKLYGGLVKPYTQGGPRRKQKSIFP